MRVYMKMGLFQFDPSVKGEGRKINLVVKKSLFLQNNCNVDGMEGKKRPACVLMKAPGEKTSY